MAVQEATTAGELEALYEVVGQLRSHLDLEAYVERVERQREDGYRLVYVESAGDPVAAAGFRIHEMLSRGKCLYVDDLVTRADERGEGHGTELVEWLVDHAREEGCDTVDLDSGFQRDRAHRFYLDRGFEIASLHFRRELD